MAKLDTDQVVLAVSALYVLFFFPTGQMLLTFVLAIAIYVMQGSVSAMAGAFIFMIALRMLTALLKPTGGKAPVRVQEGFQARDPISIHQRIAAEARKLPKSAPGSDEITGVLESPHILDNMQIAVIPPGETGAAPETKPAPLLESTRIRTPAEGFIPAVPSPDQPPKPVPFLQNGPDREAEGTALAPSGTALAAGVPAGNIQGTTTGPAGV